MKITTPLESVGWLGSPPYVVGGRKAEESQRRLRAWWREATEYLYENDYPYLVAAIRNLALVSHEDACSWCKSVGSTEPCPKRARIAALGKPDA